MCFWIDVVTLPVLVPGGYRVGLGRFCGRRQRPEPRAAWLRGAPMAARSLGKAFATVSLSVALASVTVGSSGCRSIPAHRYPLSWSRLRFRDPGLGWEASFLSRRLRRLCLHPEFL